MLSWLLRTHNRTLLTWFRLSNPRNVKQWTTSWRLDQTSKATNYTMMRTDSSWPREKWTRGQITSLFLILMIGSMPTTTPCAHLLISWTGIKKWHSSLIELWVSPLLSKTCSSISTGSPWMMEREPGNPTSRWIRTLGGLSLQLCLPITSSREPGKENMMRPWSATSLQMGNLIWAIREVLLSLKPIPTISSNTQFSGWMIRSMWSDSRIWDSMSPFLFLNSQAPREATSGKYLNLESP